MRHSIFAVAIALALHAAGALAQTVPSNAEIRKILIQRVDDYRQGVGMVVGVVDANGRRVISYGTFDKSDPREINGDTILEIGSVTKVFTSLLLADMVQRGEVALTDPISKFLPPTVKTPERGGRAITLLDLATHSSGLPRLPSDLKPGDATNPYADYGVEQLYQFLASCELKRDIGAEFEYSNLGAGLLGHLLARRARMDYESLVRSRITVPLGMTGTSISLTPEVRARLAVGHNAQLERVRDWEFGVLAGCGALRSTANDLLTFLEANLGYRKSPLTPAMAAMVQVRRPARPLGTIGLAWIMTSVQGREIVWHNGGTFGFRSFLGYDPQARRGVVVLANTFTAAGVDDIGMHVLDARSPLAAPPKAHTTVAIDLKLLDGYVGRYQLGPTFILTVTREGDQLFLQATNQPKIAVFPQGPRDFFMKVVDAQITFVPDAQGRAAQLILHQNGKDVPAKRIE